MRARTALVIGAIAMFAAVALGAFGAHALRGQLTPDLARVWQTAVQYHAWHALALLGVGLLLLNRPDLQRAGWAGGLFAAGIVLFSGSLYLLALTGIRGLGAVTPVGGLAFLAGWALLAWAIWRDA
jgi:uncharacterized membrane protein YgdD (TMEM256/DUF423 family)